MMTTNRFLPLLLAILALAGCASRPINEPITQFDPAAGYRPYVLMPKRLNNDPHTLFVLAFSGGGTRAAALSYGVLEELRRTEIAVDGQRRAQAQEGRQIDHAMQPAAQVGHAQEPGPGVRHGPDGAHGEDLAGRGQRHQQPVPGTFQRQPGGGARLGACQLQPLGQPGLQFVQRFAVGHGRGQSRTLILAISSSAPTGLTM